MFHIKHFQKEKKKENHVVLQIEGTVHLPESSACSRGGQQCFPQARILLLPLFSGALRSLSPQDLTLTLAKATQRQVSRCCLHPG